MAKIRSQHLAPAACLAVALSAFAQPRPEVAQLAAAQEQPYLETLRGLVEVESGSVDRDGLDRMAELVARDLRAVAEDVQVLEPLVPEVTRAGGLKVRPGRMVRATLTGRAPGHVLLIGHMDTVYAVGQLAQQPFRIEGGRVYGLGITDDKQGIALIVHTLSMLKAMGPDAYGTITVLVNGDEEIGSPGSRQLITELASTQDATLSFEASAFANGNLSLATSGIGTVRLRVKGRAAHAGVSPQRGVNALYEMAHQVLQMRDLSDPAAGIKVNWTIAQAGSGLNVIPPTAEATADVRVRRVEDYAIVERAVRERIEHRLLPEAVVEATFLHGRPPLVETPAARALAGHAQAIGAEIGSRVGVSPAGGGGTDAAYASLRARGPVVEGLGVPGFGSHSADNEYIARGGIVPRLYLAARLIMDVSREKAAP